jgi:hypothetical protein
MTIHFAAARDARKSPVARALSRPEARTAANDNSASAGHDLMLYAALRHFSEFGLSAPHQARERAKAAFFAGDRKSYDWWLEICRRLDKRMARDLLAEADATAGTPSS